MARIRCRLAAAFAGVAAAATVTAAPAAAEPAEPRCTDTGSATLCQTPGNSQIDASPPVEDFQPYPWWDDSWSGPLFVGG